ncbi:MAG: hypothetical protein ACPGPE_11730 [Planctomycetota bacterium]|jgi:hypothetical protein
MSSCSASYHADRIPINVAACGPDCYGVSFKVTKMEELLAADGGCQFTWTVARKKLDRGGSTEIEEYEGATSLACPETYEHIFYCDHTKNCPRFKLVLQCRVEDEEPVGAELD